MPLSASKFMEEIMNKKLLSALHGFCCKFLDSDPELVNLLDGFESINKITQMNPVGSNLGQPLFLAIFPHFLTH